MRNGIPPIPHEAPDVEVQAQRPIVPSWCKNLLKTCKLIAMVLGIITSYAIPTSMFIVGIQYNDDCPAQRYIPIYLIVGGLFIVLEAGCIYTLHDGRFCLLLLTAFNISWTLAGSFWVYSIYQPNFNNPSDRHYCHFVLYTYSLWLINSLLTLGLVAICCFVIYFL